MYIFSKLFPRVQDTVSLTYSLFPIYSKTLQFLSNQINELIDFLDYSHIIAFMQKRKVNTILELGSGFSTILTAYLSYLTGCKAYSISPSYNLLSSWLKDEEVDLIKNYCDCMEGYTISAEDLTEESYTLLNNKHIQGIGSYFQSSLEEFVNFNSRHWDFYQRQSRYYRLNPTVIYNLMFNEGDIRLVPSRKEKLNERYNLIRDSALPSDLLRMRFLSEEIKFDLIYFDSGEYDSIVEWNLMCDLLREGGFIVLRNIYFPFSIKNYLIATRLSSDPNWKIWYTSESTELGIMIAQKKEKGH